MIEMQTVLQNSNNFKKLADEAVDRVASLGDPLAGWLFTIILRHINRHNNSLVVTFEQLAEWSGMSAKSIQRKTALLEKIGIIRIIRRKKGDKNAPNEYRLSGVAYRVACETQSPTERTERPLAGTQSPSLTESKEIHHNDDDEITVSSSGEISLNEFEGRDYSIEKQDSSPQEDYLKKVGVQGKRQIQKYAKVPLERIERAFAVASHHAKENPVGMALAILDNGLFSQTITIKAEEKFRDELKTLSWADFTA